MPQPHEIVGRIYVDGQIVSATDRESPAFVSILTHDIHYAGGVFEGEVLVDGRVFRSADHSARLIRSAELVRLDHGLTVEHIEDAKAQVIRANGFTDGYVRAHVFKDERLGVNPKNLRTHFAVIVDPSKIQYWPDSIYKNGFALGTSEWRRISPRSIPQEAKAAANYQVSQLAVLDAQSRGFDDALVLSANGDIAEASVANIFFFRGDTLFTPRADGRFLNGLTRQTVIELARDIGITVIDDGRMKPKDIRTADEAFTTGSATRITPVRLIDRKPFTLESVPHSELSRVWFKVAGPRTLELMRAYADALTRPWGEAAATRAPQPDQEHSPVLAQA
jgi:branched-chain amino acid aminotransferase